MTNINVIENKISSIQKYLKIISQYRKYSQAELEKDQTLKGAVERYLYLLTQASIDLAEAIIALKDFRRPSTYSEAFYILNEEQIIPAKLTENLVKMVGFRNIIAHDYKDVDLGIVYEVLQKRYKDVEEFIRSIKKSLNL